MLLVDPCDGIATSANDVGKIKLHGFSVTPELSVFCFFFQLFNTLKECLLSFLTVTDWTFHMEKVFCIAQEKELSPQHHKGRPL